MNKPSELNFKKPDTSRWREYVPFWNSESTLPICETSFQHYTVSTRRGPISCKSMLSSLELAYLHCLAKDCFSGAGAIVDLGPYCGVGTLALASGLAKNPAGHLGRIYSFDLFLTDGYDWYFKDWELPAFGSVFPLFARITEDYCNQVIAIPGDLLKMRWNRDPIEILFRRCCQVPRIEPLGSFADFSPINSRNFYCRAAGLRPLLRVVDSSGNGVFRRPFPAYGCRFWGVGHLSECGSYFRT